MKHIFPNKHFDSEQLKKKIKIIGIILIAVTAFNVMCTLCVDENTMMNWIENIEGINECLDDEIAKFYPENEESLSTEIETSSENATEIMQ